MPLRSKRFQNDPRLEACLVQDSSHVMLGAVGNYVSKIQQALQLLDGSIIAPAEIAAQRCGPSTAAAVKAYKKKNEIIDWRRQDKADDIVGKMTIAFLDKEMEEEEKTILIRVNAHLLTLTITTYHYVQRQVQVGNTWVTQTVRVEEVERVEPGRNQEGIRLDFLGLNYIYREAGIFFILGEVTTGSLEAPDRQGQVGANRALLDTGGQLFVSARVPGTTCPRAVYIHGFADPMQLGVTMSGPNHVPLFFSSLIARRGGLLDLGLPFSYEVLAHELGHQLGLPDANELGPSNVMWQGGIRPTVPGLTQEQIDKARGSVLVQKFGKRTDIDPYFDD